MNEKKENELSVGQEAAEKICDALDNDIWDIDPTSWATEKDMAAFIDKIIEERGLGSETPDSTGVKESNETLAPCPFCGSTNPSYAPSGYQVYGGGYHVTCCNPNCRASVFLPTPGSRTGIEIWNKRVPLISSPSQTATATVRKEKENL